MDFIFTWSTVSLGWTIGFSVLQFAVSIILAVVVYRDATRLQTTIFMGPGIWCLATLVGGVVTMALYWAMHHSRLNPAISAASTKNDEDTHDEESGIL